MVALISQLGLFSYYGTPNSNITPGTISSPDATSTPNSTVPADGPLKGLFTINSLALGMTPDQAIAILGPSSAGLVREGFVSFCLGCRNLGTPCGHDDLSGTLVLSDDVVDSVFGPQLERNGSVILEPLASEQDILKVLGPPTVPAKDSAGMTNLEYKIGNDIILITLNSGKLYDVALMRPSEAGGKKVEQWVEESGL
jgi:hypothetical protein